jgi:hypothetical protein
VTRKIAYSILALSLLAGPAFADESREARTDDAPAIVEVREAKPARLSTRDRWRGAPYVRASAAENERLRSEALDRALPVQSPLGTVFGVENERIRSEALDKALPIQNPAFATGTVFGLENEQIRNEALDKSLPIQNPALATGFPAIGF